MIFLLLIILEDVKQFDLATSLWVRLLPNIYYLLPFNFINEQQFFLRLDFMLALLLCGSKA